MTTFGAWRFFSAVLILASTAVAQQARAQEFSAGLSPTSIASGGNAALTLTIDSGPAILNEPSISYTLPAGVTLVAAPTTDCFGATLTSATASQFSFASDALPANDSCTISATLTSTTPGTTPFSTVELFVAGDTGTPSFSAGLASLTVDGALPILTVAVNPSNVAVGGAATLTYTFDFSGVTNGAGSFNVVDTLPPNVVIDTPITPVQACTGLDMFVAADTGANEVRFTSPTLAFGAAAGQPILTAGTTCDIVVPISGVAGGSDVNTIETATYSEAVPLSGGSIFTQFQTLNTGALQITVDPVPPGVPQLTKEFSPNPTDGSGTVEATFVVTNRDRDIALTDIAFTDTVGGAGLTDLTFDQIVTNGCGVAAASSGSDAVSYTGGTTLGSTSCTVVVRYSYDPATAAGSFAYPTTAVAGQLNGAAVTGTAATDTLVVPSGGTPPTLTLQIVDASPGGNVVTDVAPDTTIFAEFTLTNASPTVPLTNGAFTIDLSSVPGASSAVAFSGFCGGSSIAALDTFQTIDFTGLEVAASGSCTFAAQLAIDAGAPGSTVALQTSDLTAAVAGQGVLVGGASASFTVSGGLGLVGVQDVPTVAPGAATTLTTTLTADTENASTLTGLALSQDVGAIGALNFVSVQSNSCGGLLAASGDTYSLTNGTLAPGGSCTLVVNVMAAAAASGGTTESIETSVITANGGALTFAPAAGSVTIATGLGFALEILGGPVQPGGTVTGRYTISNDNSSAATGIVFTHSVNTGFSGLTVAGTTSTDTCGGTYSPSGAFVIYTNGTLAAGASCDIEIAYTAGSSLPAGDAATTATSNLSATVGSVSVIGSTASAAIPLDASGFVVTKSFGAASVVAGSTIPLTIGFEATGGGTVSSISVTDDLDAFVTGATIDSVGTDTCSASGVTAGASVLSPSSITLTGGASCAVTVNVAIPAATAAGNYTNTTSTASGVLNSVAVSTPAVSASVAVVSPTASATLVKSFGAGTVNSGASTTVSYTIDNPAGGAPLTRLGLTDPIGTDIPGATLSGFTGSCGTGSTISGTSTLLLANGVLDPGQSCTFGATVTLPVLAPAVFTSTTSALTDAGLDVALPQAASLTVVSPPPVVTVSTSAATIVAGTDLGVIYTIDNSASAVAISNLSFDQAFGAFLPGPGGTANNSCGGAFIPTLTGATLVGGSIPAGGTCALEADLTSATFGTQSLPAPTVGATEFPSIANAAAFSVNVIAPPPPLFAAAFAPTSIEQGTTATATFTIDNSAALIPASALAVSNTLPSGIAVADPSNASTTCTGGTLTATAGSSVVSYSGGTVNPGSSCTVTFDVLGLTVGTAVNTTGALTSNFGNSGTASASVTVTTPPTVTGSIIFAPGSVAQGVTSTYALQLNSGAAAIDTLNIAASQTLPADVVVASTPNIANSCSGGTVTAPAGGGTISLSGGTLGPGAICSVSVDVVSVVAASYPVTLTSLSSDFGPQTTLSSTTLTVTPAPLMTITAAFDPASLPQGGVTTLTTTLDNTAAAIPSTVTTFSDPLPSGLAPAFPANESSSCGGTVDLVGTALVVQGATVDAGGTCTFSLDVTSSQAATFNNDVDTVATSTGNQFSVGAASVTFTPAPPVTSALAAAPATIEQGAISTITVSFDNTGALVAAQSLGNVVRFPTGVTLATPDGFSTDCPAPNGLVSDMGQVTVNASQLQAGATCSAQFDVQAVVTGMQTLTNDGTTSSLGAGAGTDVALNVTAAAAPGFAKVFAPSTVELGDVSRLTLTVDNSGALVPAAGGTITDTFPAGLELAAVPDVAASCSSGASTVGTVATAADGFSVSSLTVAAQEVCTYAVNVRAVQGPSLVNTTDELTTSLGSSGTASATLTVSDAPQPTLSAAFTPSTVVQGGTSRYEVTLTNLSTLIDATGATVSATLPTDMVVAPAPNTSLSCSAGTVTAAAGGSSVSLSGGTIPLGASCALAVDVVSTSLDPSQTVTTSTLVTDIGASAAGAEAVLTLTPAPLPGFAKAFAPASVLQGEVSTLTYTVDNGTALVTAGDLTLGETFAGGPVLADPPNFGGTCGGTPTGAAGDASFGLTGGSVAAGATCEVTVDVTSPDTGTFDTVSDDLVTTLGNSGTAAATLTVGAAPVPVLTVDFDQTSVVQGGAAVLTYTLQNRAAVPATDISFDNSLPDGMSADPAGTAANGCGGTFSASGQGPEVSLAAGAVAAGDTCVITLPVVATIVGANDYAVAFATSLGDTAEASDSLEVTAAPVPVMAVQFTPDTIVEGDVSRFEITIDNSASLIDAEDIDVGLEVFAPLAVPVATNEASTCVNPSFTLTPGDDDVSFTADSVPAGASCTLAFDIRGIEDGSAIQGALITSSLGTTTPEVASITITPAGAPLVSGAFAPATITQGNASTLTYTIDNSANLIEASEAAFSVALGGTMQVAADPVAATTCAAGTVTAVAGDAAFSLAGGTVAEGTTCTVSVNVTSFDAGSFTATASALTSSLGNSAAAAPVSLSVGTAPAPLFLQAFVPPTIGQGQTTRLELTVDNSASGLPAAQTGRLSAQSMMAGSLGFDATLPAGLTVSPAPNASNSCGGAVTADPNGGTVTLAGGAVPGGQTCTVGVDVTTITEGVTPAVTGSLSSSLGGASLAVPNTPLTVTNNPFGTVNFVQNSVADGTFNFASNLAAFNFAISTAGGSGSFGPVSVETGTYTITQTRPAGIGNETLVCSDMNSTVDVTAGTVTLVVDLGDNITCTWGAVNSQAETVDQINTFLNRRNNLILSTGPSAARRMARLNQGVGAAETLRFQQGDLASATPFTFDLLSLGSNSYKFATSLQQIERSRRMFRLAVDGVEDNSEVWTPPRWDVWFEASYTRYEATGGADGHFGIAYLGADYLISEDILAGFLLQYDSLDDGDDGGATIEGTGWMAGPYVTARIAPNLIFDGRIAYGQSSNSVSPFGTYTDEFDTDRFLIDATLSGNFDWDNWVVTPNLSLSYIEDRAEGYIDSLGVAIPEQKVSLGQIRLGPTFSTTFEGRNQTVIRPTFTVNGIYNFSDTDGVTIVNDTSGETDGFRARIEAAVQITGRSGIDLTFGMHYDGIGASDFEAYGARLQLSIPLN